MNKTFKKVLSVVLSLAMVMTSITVYNTTAKAVDVASIEFSSVTVKNGMIDKVEWTNPEATKSNKIYIYTEDKAADITAETVFDAADSAKSADANWVWNDNAEIRTWVNNVITNKGGTITGMKENGGSYVIVVVDYDVDGNVIAFGKTDTIVVEPFVVDNDNLNFAGTKYETMLENDGPTFTWNLITGAVRYNFTATLDGVVKMNKDFSNTTESYYYWSSDVQGSAPGQTYTVTLKAYNAEGDVITQESIEGVAAYYKEVAPVEPNQTEEVDQEIVSVDNVAEWIDIPGTAENGATAQVSQNINANAGLYGFYETAGTPQDWNNVRNVAIANEPVLAFVKGANENIIIGNNDGKGMKYLNPKNDNNTLVWQGGGDCIYINQSLLSAATGETKYYSVTVGTDTFLIKVVGADPVTYHKVTIDGTEVAQVAEGDTYTVAGDAEYGYYADGVAYKAGAEITVNADVAFTSINTLSVTAEQGAGIRLVNDDKGAGIRFQATVSSDNMTAVESAAITEGMLITANDLYEAKGDSALDLTSAYTYKNIVNTGWYNDTVGTYCGSIVKIAESNYIRSFIARAYVTVTYSDGSTKTVYSNMTGARSIQYVASAIKNAGYPNIAEADKELVDKFAAAK